MSEHFNQAKAKVISYIKKGKIQKDAGQKALNHLKKFMAQGKSPDIDDILVKMGALKKKPKAAAAPKRKLYTVDEEHNPYLEKRRKSKSKTPIIAAVAVGVSLILVFLGIHVRNSMLADHHNQTKQREEKNKQIEEENKRKELEAIKRKEEEALRKKEEEAKKKAAEESGEAEDEGDDNVKVVITPEGDDGVDFDGMVEEPEDE